MKDKKDVSKKVFEDDDLKKIHEILNTLGLNRTHRIYIRKDLPSVIAKMKKRRVILYDPGSISMLH